MTINRLHELEQNMPNILPTLKEIAAAVMYAAEADTLEKVLERIALVSQQFVHARYVALAVPDRKGGLKYFKTVGVSPEEIAAIPHPPRGLGLLGAMHDQEIIRLQNIAEDPRSIGFPPNHPPMTSLLGVPIQIGRRFYGMLYMSDRIDGKSFTDEDQWLIEVLAGYAALAIAGVEISEQHSRLVLLEERERVAAELHDGIIQSLYAIGMHLQLLQIENTLPPESLNEAIGNLDTVIEDIRHYIQNLKAASYQHQTLYSALKDILARLHIPEDLRVQINAPDRHPHFAPSVFEAICQITHEAVSNVIRHARATQLVVSTRQYDSHFELIVEDDGQGFDLQSINDHEGLGLYNIQRRARLHNGQIQIRSASGEGTRLTLKIPTKTK